MKLWWHYKMGDGRYSPPPHNVTKKKSNISLNAKCQLRFLMVNMKLVFRVGLSNQSELWQTCIQRGGGLSCLMIAAHFPRYQLVFQMCY